MENNFKLLKIENKKIVFKFFFLINFVTNQDKKVTKIIN